VIDLLAFFFALTHPLCLTLGLPCSLSLSRSLSLSFSLFLLSHPLPSVSIDDCTSLQPMRFFILSALRNVALLSFGDEGEEASAEIGILPGFLHRLFKQEASAATRVPAQTV
jgi:hypothetical protein